MNKLQCDRDSTSSDHADAPGHGPCVRPRDDILARAVVLWALARLHSPEGGRCKSIE